MRRACWACDNGAMTVPACAAPGKAGISADDLPAVQSAALPSRPFGSASFPLATFQSALLDWFGRAKRDLDWRTTRDPYRVWISEIMLQQTRVAAVVPYYRRFLERFPTVKELAEAPEDEVLRLWSGLGYYSRARNLQNAARQIVERHGGEFPRAPGQALALPGIGA